MTSLMIELMILNPFQTALLRRCFNDTLKFEIF